MVYTSDYELISSLSYGCADTTQQQNVSFSNRSKRSEHDDKPAALPTMVHLMVASSSLRREGQGAQAHFAQDGCCMSHRRDRTKAVSIPLADSRLSAWSPGT